MGSKNRYAKYLLPIILKDRTPDQWYVEPFVGGCNMIDKVDGKRIGNDNNRALINMWKATQNGWLPPENMTESRYKEFKEHQEWQTPEQAFVGIGCSYGGKWFGGFARGNDNNGKPRNYAKESAENLKKQISKLSDVDFYSGDYKHFDIPHNSIVYCDPPYFGTTSYREKIKTLEFWEWCDKLVAGSCKVFVSEYQAPEDWKCVWQKEVNSSLTKETGSKKAIERLFTKFPQ